MESERLVDLKASKAVARVTRRFEGSGSVERVLDSMGPAVFELVSADPALQGKKLKFERGYGGFLVGVGGPVFAPAVGLRGAAGAEVRFGQLHLFADGAFEYFVSSDAATHDPYAVLVSAGAGWLF